MEKCPKCKKPTTLKLIGFNKTKGEVYKKCCWCWHSVTEPYVDVVRWKVPSPPELTKQLFVEEK